MLTQADLSEEERTRCEVWTRVMGYHRPVSAFNKGKQAEHRDRQQFVEGAVNVGMGSFVECETMSVTAN